MITLEYLKFILYYDPEIGLFTWKVNLALTDLVGKEAGWKDEHGYILIQIGSKTYRASRLAWLYMTGEWLSYPEFEVDHKNLNKSDNRWKNLRKATRDQNLYNLPTYKNNLHGIKGVGFHKASGKFRARISVKGKHIHLGLFDTIEDAKKAYNEVAIKERWEFSRL